MNWHVDGRVNYCIKRRRKTCGGWRRCHCCSLRSRCGAKIRALLQRLRPLCDFAPKFETTLYRSAPKLKIFSRLRIQSSPICILKSVIVEVSIIASAFLILAAVIYFVTRACDFRIASLFLYSAKFAFATLLLCGRILKPSKKISYTLLSDVLSYHLRQCRFLHPYLVPQHLFFLLLLRQLKAILYTAILCACLSLQFLLRYLPNSPVFAHSLENLTNEVL